MSDAADPGNPPIIMGSGPIYTQLAFEDTAPPGGAKFRHLPIPFEHIVHAQFGKRLDAMQRTAEEFVAGLPSEVVKEHLVQRGTALPPGENLPIWEPGFTDQGVITIPAAMNAPQSKVRMAVWDTNQIERNAQNGEFGYPVVYVDLIPPHMIPPTSSKRNQVHVNFSQAGELCAWESKGEQVIGRTPLPSTGRLGFTESGGLWLTNRGSDNWTYVGQTDDPASQERLIALLTERNLLAPSSQHTGRGFFNKMVSTVFRQGNNAG
jgi:hypothetical protein